MKIVRILIAASFALFAANTARAVEPGCQSVDRTLSVLESVGAKVEFLDGEAKVRAVRSYNEMPPETDIPWDIVLVGRLPDGRGVIAFGMNGGLCEIAMLPGEVLDRLVDTFKGQGI